MPRGGRAGPAEPPIRPRGACAPAGAARTSRGAGKVQREVSPAERGRRQSGRHSGNERGCLRALLLPAHTRQPEEEGSGGQMKSPQNACLQLTLTPRFAHASPKVYAWITRRGLLHCTTRQNKRSKSLSNVNFFFKENFSILASQRDNETSFQKSTEAIGRPLRGLGRNPRGAGRPHGPPSGWEGTRPRRGPHQRGAHADPAAEDG